MHIGNFQTLKASLTLSVMALFALTLTACGGGGGGGGGSSLPQRVEIVYPTQNMVLEEADLNTDFEIRWVDNPTTNTHIFLNGTDITSMFRDVSGGMVAGTFGLQVLLNENNTLKVTMNGGQDESVSFKAGKMRLPHPIVRSVEDGVNPDTKHIKGSIRQKDPVYDPLDVARYKANGGSDWVALLLNTLPLKESTVLDKYRTFYHEALPYPVSAAESPATADIILNTQNDSGVSDTVKMALPERLLSKALAFQLNNSAFTVFENIISEKIESGAWLDTQKVFDDSPELCYLVNAVKYGNPNSTEYPECRLTISGVSFSGAVVTDLSTIDNAGSGFYAKASIQLTGMTIRPRVTAYDGDPLAEVGAVEFDLPLRHHPMLSITFNVDQATGKIIALDLAGSDAVNISFEVYEATNVTCDDSLCPGGIDAVAASAVIISGFRNAPIRVGVLNDYAGACDTDKNTDDHPDCVYLLDLSNNENKLFQHPNLAAFFEQTVANYKVDPLDEQTVLQRIALKEHNDIYDKANDPEYSPHYIYRAEDLVDGEPVSGAEARSEALDVAKGSVVAEAVSSGDVTPKGAFVAIDALYATDNVVNDPEEYKQALGSYYQPTGSSIVESNDISEVDDDMVIALSKNYINQRLMEMYRQDFFGLQTHITDENDLPTLGTCEGVASPLGTMGASLISTLDSYGIDHDLGPDPYDPNNLCDGVEVNMHALAVPYISLVDDGQEGIVQLNIEALKVDISVPGKKINGQAAQISSEIDVRARMTFGLGSPLSVDYGLPHASIERDDLSVLVAYVNSPTVTILTQTRKLLLEEDFQPLVLNMLHGELEELGGNLIEPLVFQKDVTNLTLWDEPLFNEQKKYQVNLTGFGVDSAEEYLLLKGNICDASASAPAGVVCSASQASFISLELYDTSLDDFCTVYSDNCPK